MASATRRIASISLATSLAFFISCEKHHVGELEYHPPHSGDKHHADDAQGATSHDENAHPMNSPTPPERGRTPAEFFPTATPVAPEKNG